jgi:hypothetical protein
LVTTKPGQADHREAHDRATTEGSAAVADFITDDLGGFLGRLNAQLLG